MLVMVLGFFNLLMAVLIEALASAQAEQHEAPGVVREICEICSDLAHRVKRAVSFSARTAYMTDVELHKLLLGQHHRILKDQDLRTLVSCVSPCWITPNVSGCHGAVEHNSDKIAIIILYRGHISVH